jgi:tetraacyldisaccharide 4'-kinase
MDWPLPIRILLWPLSLLYGLLVRSKTALYRVGFFRHQRLQGAVISVGNITVGGTGKTPMVLWLAERFLSQGKSVAILSRGYRGAGGSSDEVELMRKRLGNRARFGIGPSRYEQGRALERAAPVDLFLLDDGFQHLQLARDLDIVMVDGSRRRSDDWLLPAGRLREPASACSRADLLVVTRRAEQPPVEARHTFSAQARLLGFRKRHTNGEVCSASEIGPGPFFSFCGIGNPQAFAEDLKRWHVPVAAARVFRDHHKYSAKDLEGVEIEAVRAGAVGLISTEKDEQNLPEWKSKLPIYIATIDLEIASEGEFVAAIDRILAGRRSSLS